MRLRWEILSAARTLLLTVAGFGMISAGAFLWHPIAGCITSGASLLIIEALATTDRPTAGGAP